MDKPNSALRDAEVRLPPLPSSARSLVEEYESLRELGASRTVRMINEVLAILATEGEFASEVDLLRAILQAADYFRRTRGGVTPAVGNTLDRVFEGIDARKGQGLLAMRQFIVGRTEALNQESLQNTARIARYGANLLSSLTHVLAYDYSGTVMAALQQASEDGKVLHLVVPESRTLNGGRPIADQAVRWGHSVSFIADAVIGAFMPRVQVVLEGVETLVADGAFMGTPGTFTVALLAHHFRVPFYALTETLKIAPDTLYGALPEVAGRSLAAVFDYPDSFPKPKAVSVESPGLERIPAEFVTAYITERGLLLPHAVWQEACELQARAAP